jgi:DNA polymerase IV
VTARKRSRVERQIICYEIPGFEIALARVADLALRGRPVAVAPSSPRAVLADVSVEAAHEGLSRGMPVAVARRFCPGVRLIPPDAKRLQTGHQQILAVVQRYVPLWESVTPGALLCDMTGTRQLFGRTLDIGMRIEKEVAQRYQLAGVMGVGTNRLVAQLAAGLVHPIQAYDVWPGGEERFVRPLHVERLPLGNDPEARALHRRLKDLHVVTFGDLAAIPYAALEVAFPRHAAQLAQWAHGDDPAPLRVPWQQPVVDRHRTLRHESIDHQAVEAEVYALLEEICATLRIQRRACRSFTVRLTYADGQHVTRRGSLKRATCWEGDWWPVVQGLVSKLFQRRVRIRGVGLRAEHLDPLVEQLALFPESSVDGRPRERDHRLALALDRLKTRFGQRAIQWGQVR